MILGSVESGLGSLGSQLGGLYRFTTGGVIPPGPPVIFSGVHVIHVTSASPMTVTLTGDGPALRRQTRGSMTLNATSGGPEVRRRSSGSPTVRDVEGQ